MHSRGGQGSGHNCNCLSVKPCLSVPLISLCDNFTYFYRRNFPKLKDTCSTLIDRLSGRLAHVAKNTTLRLPRLPTAHPSYLPPALIAPAQLDLHFGARQRGVKSAKGLNYRKSGFDGNRPTSRNYIQYIYS